MVMITVIFAWHIGQHVKIQTRVTFNIHTLVQKVNNVVLSGRKCTKLHYLVWKVPTKRA